MSESTTFAAAPLAALIASKVYYHLGNLDDALSFALAAGKQLPLALDSHSSPAEAEYVETIIGTSISRDHSRASSRCTHADCRALPARAIDSYVATRSSPDAAPVDSRLEAIVEGMFSRCERDGEYKQALGIALSTA